eukprot:16316787-Heterocapsa_arctica.AAC.1
MDHKGWLELYCVTCRQWCAGTHLSSKKHLGWVAHYEEQRAAREGLVLTPAGTAGDSAVRRRTPPAHEAGAAAH